MQALKTEDGIPVPGYYANVRSSDNKVLGVVSDKYAVVQNREAFAFTDGLLGAGVRYETAGSLMGGRRVWILAKLPNEYIIKGDRISPYMVFSNNHDGSGSIKAALTPIRVVCNNTLCMALQTAQRSWSTKHTGDIRSRVLHAPDLKNLPENGYRLYNAVSDYANHAKPLRETNSDQENVFAKAIDRVQ